MKKIIIILVIFTFILTGCNNKNSEIFKEAEEKVNNVINSFTNVSEEKILESINYIENNIDNVKDTKVYKELAYHVTYLKIVGKNKLNENSELTSLVEKTEKYLMSQEKELKKDIKEIFEDIKKVKKSEVKKYFNNYHISQTISNIKEKQSKEVAQDIKDSNMVNEKNINKAIEYIAQYIEYPLTNEETIEKIIYYTLYLESLGNEMKSNIIYTLAENMLNYLTTLDEQDKVKALNTLNEILRNKNQIISDFYSSIINN